MQKEKRVRIRKEQYSVYTARDGKTFNSEEECRVHEMILDGEARVCPTCKGEKECYHREVVGYTGGLQWHGEPIYGQKWGKCPTCGGKGYQVKKETWE